MNAFYPITRRLTAVLVGVVALLGLLATPAQAQSCTTGSAEADLDINNVRAKLYNIGGLFWRGSGAQYVVPKESGLVSIFASGIWVGGQVDGNLRFAGSTYGPWEYWPGPLDAAGNVTAATCAEWDRFWKVSIQDIRDYNSNGTATGDLQSWPISHGAPFFVDTNGNGRRDATLDADGDGNLDEPRQELTLGDPGYGTRQLDLAGGERPDIIGDQGIWWVMNDKGGSHDWSELQAIGLEVRAHAFAFATADALNNTTFYRYQFIYRGTEPMTDTYIALFSDPDLGQFNDDYVGSDPELGLGFVYNGDNFDEGGSGYGPVPPALGYDFFQGPLVGNGAGSAFNDGVDNDGDGEVDEEDERLAIEKFFYFTNGGTVTSDPGNGNEAYTYMQGLWKDGSPLREGGDGFNTNGPPVDFAFPGDPPRFWSEYNSDGAGSANTPADRRFGVSSGPFTFQPGQQQEIVFGIVWSQAQGATVQPQIVSVRQLKFDDRTVQGAFNAEFSLPEPPPGVLVTATGLDQEVVLEWDSETGDLSDIFGYEVESPFAPPSATDGTYNFEGFKIIQYRDQADQNGQLIGTFDLKNNVTTIVDEALDPLVGEVVTAVVAQGNDSGTEFNTPTAVNIVTDVFTNAPLRNGTSYYFGIQPYAVNEASTGQKVFAAPVTRVEVRPTKVGPTVAQTGTGTALTGAPAASNGGEGSVIARVVNPASLTNDVYRVEFFTQTDGSGNEVGLNYRIVNATSNTVVFGGQDYYDRNGEVAPLGPDVFRVGGLAFDVTGPEATFTNFLTTANAGGELATPTGAAADFQGYPVPERPFFGSQGGTQSANTPANESGLAWMWGAAEVLTGHTFDEFLSGVAGIGGPREANVIPYDWEIRFTSGTNYAAIYSETGTFGAAARLIEVPFEIWNTGIGTPDDPSDDVRYFPTIFDLDFSVYRDGSGNRAWNLISDYGIQNTFGCCDGDSDMSSAQNDPYFDAITWVQPPTGLAPGEAGYEQLVAAIQADAAAAGATIGGLPIALRRMTGMLWNGGSTCSVDLDADGNCPVEGGLSYDQAFVPEEGSVFRFVTSKPNQPGDVFTVDPAEVAAIPADDRDATAVEEALDLMAITPNPYRGFSGYETAGDETIARFVNLPAQATIRVFTLSGTLVRTIEKSNPATATIDWNLRTEAGLPVASGLYLIHIEARSASGAVLGERILKFGVIQRRTQLDVL